MFGDTPIAIPLSFENTKFPTVEDKMRTLIRNQEEALAAHELAQNRMADRQRSTFTPFKLEDRVWLDTRNLKTNHHKKISLWWEGPFKITKVIGPVTYQLELPHSWRIHNVFHATLLWQYKENDVYRANFPRPTPELIEGKEVYEIEYIIRHRRRGWGYQYYMKWKGYLISETSWEPEEVFSNDGDLLTQYKERHQLW